MPAPPRAPRPLRRLTVLSETVAAGRPECARWPQSRADRPYPPAEGVLRSETVDDGRGELGGLDLGGALHEAGEVVGDHLVGDGGLEGADDVVGGTLPAEVLEHEHAR